MVSVSGGVPALADRRSPPDNTNAARTTRAMWKGLITSPSISVVFGAYWKPAGENLWSERLAPRGRGVNIKHQALSYHIRNVPVLSTIEMSPSFGFTLPRNSVSVPLP